MDTRPQTLTSWHCAGEVVLRAYPKPEPVSLDAARALHSFLLSETLDAARRGHGDALDLLKRLEGDLRVAIHQAADWRRASRGIAA